MVRVFIRLAGIVSTGVAYDLRRAAFAKLQGLSLRPPAGGLDHARLTSDCDRISSMLPWTLLDTVWGILMLAGISAMMFWMNPSLALAVLCIAAVIGGDRGVPEKTHPHARSRAANSKILRGSAKASGVRTSKAFVRERENLEEFQADSGNVSALRREREIRRGVPAHRDDARSHWRRISWRGAC
jgi:ATP-binding cassette subfamily B protein